MPFDTLAMAAVRDELVTARGAQIQRVIQPSIASIALQLYGQGVQRWLICSADPQFARVSFSSERLAKAFPTPSAFVMLLRKHLVGARIAGVEQEHMERVLKISCRGALATALIVEVMGKHSNVVLVDAEGSILGAVKTVPPRQSRVRPIMAGNGYVPPPPRVRNESIYPPGPLLDPLADKVDFKVFLEGAPAGTRVRDALVGLMQGCSPFLASQIELPVCGEPSLPLQRTDLEALVTACGSVFELYESRNWVPCAFTNTNGRRDFAPYSPYGVTDIVAVSSMSEAIELSWSSDTSTDSLASARREVLSQIERAKRAATRRIAALQQGLAAAGDAEKAMVSGQMIQAYQHAVTQGDDILHIPEMELSIPLDPLLTPQGNAERYFRRYHKLRDAARRIPQLLSEAQVEEARLADLHVFTTLADAEGTLRDLAREVKGTVEPAQPTRKKGKKRGPLRFKFGESTLLVGRNAQENDELTFRLAHRDDTWLHAFERTGAHVVLQGAGSEPDDEVLTHAARVAAYFSEGREDTRVDVTVTRVRDVRKVPGGLPGRVTFRNARTLRVEPRVDDWTAVRGN